MSSMYTVHMLGEGGSLIHTFKHTCSTHMHTHHQSLGGYKAVAYSKNPPIRAGPYGTVIPWGREEKRESMWVVAGGGKDAGYCEDANLMHPTSC